MLYTHGQTAPPPLGQTPQPDIDVKTLSTTMHYSGMRTGRSLTVCRSLHPRGVWSRGGGFAPSRRGGLVPGGGLCIPACTGADPPPVDRHTLVKILPWPNFFAAGKNCLIVFVRADPGLPVAEALTLGGG